MSANPWMKFYPRDWRGDQALRAVSIAARGLWMECLCIMHEAKPYGHLVLNGQKVADDTLARMAGVSVDEVLALLAELRQAGVLSMTSKEVIFSRRMTKDYSRAQKGKKAVTKRWSQVSDNQEQSDRPNRSPNREPITQKPEARSHTDKDHHADDGFDEWYLAYPKHVGRGQAEKAYRTALKIAEPLVLLEGAKRYALQRAGQDAQYTAGPSVWLNGKRWLDEDAPPVSGAAGESKYRGISDRYRGAA